MSNYVNKFFNDIKGKKVAFIGIGTSNLPLIKQFAEKGAVVTACDRKDFDSLGENAVQAKEYGAQLVLGENYLSEIDADIVFRSPGTPFYKDELVALRNKGVVLTSEMEVFFVNKLKFLKFFIEFGYKLKYFRYFIQLRAVFSVITKQFLYIIFLLWKIVKFVESLFFACGKLLVMLNVDF